MNFFRRWLRRFSYLVAVSAALLLTALLVFYLWFPNLAGHKDTVEEFLSAEIEQPVVIQFLETSWQGMHLSFQARGIRVRGVEDTQSALRLGELRMLVDPLPLLWGSVRLKDLTLSGITFELVRSESGQIKVAELAKSAPSGQQELGALGWWFRQQNVRIEKANVVWHDTRIPEKTFNFSDITLAMRSDGDTRYLTGSAQLPHGLGQRVSINGRLNGVPVGDNDWGGVMDVAFKELNIGELSRMLPGSIPPGSKGRLSAQFSTSLVNGRPVGGVGEIKITNFSVPYPSADTPLLVKHISSEMSWQRDAQGWRVLLLQPEFDVGETLQIGQMEIAWMKEGYTFRAESVDLAKVVTGIKKLKVKLPWQYVIDRVRPAGKINSATISITGKLQQPSDWRFEGEFEGLSWDPYQHFPGFAGVYGKLQIDPEQGRLSMRESNVELDFPQVLRAPVRFSRLRGNIAWSRDEKNWSVHATQLELANQDIEISNVSVLARLPVDPGPSPYIDARADFQRMQLASIKKYLPAKVMKPKAVEWVDHAFAGGRADDGKFRLRGLVKDFPFKDDRGGGEFRLSATVRDGVLVYSPEWPEVKDIKASVIFDNEWFRVKAEHGTYMNSEIIHTTAVSEELFLKKKPKLLQIDGELRAKVGDVTEFLTRGPLIKQKDEIPQMRGSGEGILTLKLDLPLGRLKESTQVAGTYTFKGASVDLVKSDIGLDKLSGQISFTERTVRGENLTAQMLSGPVTVNVSSVKPHKPPHFAIDFAGQGNVKGLTSILGNSIVGFLQGERIPWTGRLEVGQGKTLLTVNSPGTGLASDLPPPLAKDAAGRWDIATRVAFEHHAREITFNVGDRLSGALLMRGKDEQTVFERGAIGFNKGKQTLPQDPGIQVAAATTAFDLDAWIKTWERGRRFAAEAAGDKNGTSFVDALRKVRLDTRALKFLGRELQEMQIDAHSTDSIDWVMRLSGSAAVGAARARFSRTPDRSPDFKFVLYRLYWPKGLEQKRDEGKSLERESPREYPYLAIDADDFRYGDWRLGSLHLRAAPQDGTWQIKNVTTEHPALRVTASGVWHEPNPDQ